MRRLRLAEGIHVLWALVLMGGGLCGVAQPEGTRPNILLIMADDLGYETLGCYGGTSYETPNLDRLAKGGTRFMNCHSTPKCSPSRVTLMTGRYTFRTTLEWGLLPDREITFGRMMQSAGYATALAGKWQMQLLKDNPHHVSQKGFEESCVWAWHEGPRYWTPAVYENGEFHEYPADTYGPDVYVDFLMEFMEENRERPFFAYYPMCLTHFPKTGKKYHEPKGPNGSYQTYKEMVERMDERVGRLVDKLESLGLRENTLVLFTGDNGTPTKVRSDLGGRTIQGGKGKLTDAGTHVPLIANWPGATPKGAVREDLIDFTDFMPTFAELGEADLPEVTLDGRSFAPQLQGEEGNPREWIYTEWTNGAWARTKDWKLYRNGNLIDMNADPEEQSPVPAHKNGAADSIREQLAKVLKTLTDDR